MTMKLKLLTALFMAAALAADGQTNAAGDVELLKSLTADVAADAPWLTWTEPTNNAASGALGYIVSYSSNDTPGGWQQWTTVNVGTNAILIPSWWPTNRWVTMQTYSLTSTSLMAAPSLYWTNVPAVVAPVPMLLPPSGLLFTNMNPNIWILPVNTK